MNALRLSLVIALSLAACGDFDAAVGTYCSNHEGTAGCDGGAVGGGAAGGGTAGGGTAGGGTAGGGTAGGGGTGGGAAGGGAAGGGTAGGGAAGGGAAGGGTAGGGATGGGATGGGGGAVDSGVDAGVDAGDDAGTDAGTIDAGLAWELALGNDHTCAREVSTGLLWCFGHNDRRQLGASYPVGNVVATPSTPPLDPADAVSAGGDHTCVIIDGGGVCFGQNSEGALGHPGSEPMVAPTNVTAVDAGLRQLTCGGVSQLDFSCARTTGNEVWCWGNNADGELGSAAPGPTARRVGGFLATQLSSFGNTSCAILTDAGLSCWGANGAGQLGQGNLNPVSGPVTVPLVEAVTSVAVGVTHACALTSTGSVLCWGNPAANRTGHDAGVGPAPVTGLAAAKAISAGGANSCAILLNGQVWCWGYNAENELGTQSVSATGPVRTMSLPAAAVQVATGALHSCASLANGQVWCWGYAAFGQVGVWSSPQLPRKVLPP